jgi:hypothetical protein
MAIMNPLPRFGVVNDDPTFAAITAHRAAIKKMLLAFNKVDALANVYRRAKKEYAIAKHAEKRAERQLLRGSKKGQTHCACPRRSYGLTLQALCALPQRLESLRRTPTSGMINGCGKDRCVAAVAKMQEGHAIARGLQVYRASSRKCGRSQRVN